MNDKIIQYIAMIHEYKGRSQLYISKNKRALKKLNEYKIIKNIRYADTSIKEIRILELINIPSLANNKEEYKIIKYISELKKIEKDYNKIELSSKYISKIYNNIYEDEIDLSCIDKVCKEFNENIDKKNSLILISNFTYDFLKTLNFSKESIRIVRILVFLLLYKYGYDVSRYISLDEKISKNTEKIKEIKYSKDKFLYHFLKIVLEAYQDFEKRIDIYDSRSKAIDHVRSVINEKRNKFTKLDVLKLCPHIGRASVENSLKKLVHEGILSKRGKGKNTFYTKGDNTDEI